MPGTTCQKKTNETFSIILLCCRLWCFMSSFPPSVLICLVSPFFSFRCHSFSFSLGSCQPFPSLSVAFPVSPGLFSSLFLLIFLCHLPSYPCCYPFHSMFLFHFPSAFSSSSVFLLSLGGVPTREVWRATLACRQSPLVGTPPTLRFKGPTQQSEEQKQKCFGKKNNPNLEQISQPRFTLRTKTESHLPYEGTFLNKKTSGHTHFQIFKARSSGMRGPIWFYIRACGQVTTFIVFKACSGNKDAIWYFLNVCKYVCLRKKKAKWPCLISKWVNECVWVKLSVSNCRDIQLRCHYT